MICLLALQNVNEAIYTHMYTYSSNHFRKSQGSLKTGFIHQRHLTKNQ